MSILSVRMVWIPFSEKSLLMTINLQEDAVAESAGPCYRSRSRVHQLPESRSRGFPLRLDLHGN